MGRRGFTIVTWSCTAALAALMADPSPAAQKKSMEQAPSVLSAKPSKPSPEQAQQSAKKPVTPTVTERRLGAVQIPTKQVPSESKPATMKANRRHKVHKKIPPKAVVQPRRDLMYHGMLEDSQRYDPRPASHMAGVPNPLTPDLTHDHFQELDRNQDGKIDPVERAFGRLDMDRDLGDRQFR